MTSYFESVLERHYQNFIFTYKMYAYSSKLVECLYHDALEEIKHLVKQFQKRAIPTLNYIFIVAYIVVKSNIFTLLESV